MKRSSVERLSVCLIASWVVCLSGQEKALASVWDGIYSDAQAARGEPAYRKSCGSCHGDEMKGKGQTPALAGPGFAANWDGMPVGDLFDKIQDSMPADRPGVLSKETNADILAYILKFNKFPAGAKELPPNPDALRDVRFEIERK